MGLLSSGKTDIGRKRKSNQDAIYLQAEKNLFLVADGMGGHLGGDIASGMCVESVAKYFADHSNEGPLALMHDGLLQANRDIFDRSQAEPDLKGMGTTAVLLHFRDTHAYIANVGDSRAYLVGQKKIFQITRDHSLVQEKLNLGIYDREQARQDKMKNVLVRSIGFEPQVEIDVFSYKVARSDIFMICSDGLHGKVTDKNMVEIINYYIPDPGTCSQSDIARAVDALVQQANANGGQDNISVVMVVAQ